MKTSDVPHLARNLLEEHGLAQLGWRFQWDHARRRAGACKYGKKAITLSRYYVELNVVDRPDDIIDTILHEIAHALTPHHGHDKEWKRVAAEVGAEPKRCYDNTVVMPEGRYVAKCSGCGKEFRRHKRERAGRWRYCAKCGPERGRLSFTCQENATPVYQPQAPPPAKKVR